MNCLQLSLASELCERKEVEFPLKYLSDGFDQIMSKRESQRPLNYHSENQDCRKTRTASVQLVQISIIHPLYIIEVTSSQQFQNHGFAFEIGGLNSQINF